jgi:protein-S-isoprenylcysteine O-methyltransferase Ste14
MNIAIVIIMIVILLLIVAIVVIIIEMTSKKTPVPKIYRYIYLGCIGVGLLLLFGAALAARKPKVVIPVAPVGYAPL